MGDTLGITALNNLHDAQYRSAQAWLGLLGCRSCFLSLPLDDGPVRELPDHALPARHDKPSWTSQHWEREE